MESVQLVLSIPRVGSSEEKQQAFLAKAKSLYQGKYDYSKTVYTKAHNNIIIICPKHGEFYKTPDNHLHGQGCPSCLPSKKPKYIILASDFKNKAKSIYGENTYDYGDLLKEDTVEIHSKKLFYCNKHSKYFSQKPADFLKGIAGCDECRGNKISKSKTKLFENFQQQANLKYNSKYTYLQENYINSTTPIKIICPLHGEFFQTPYNHLKGKSGCPKCASNYQLSQEDFIKLLQDIYGDKFDYSKIEYETILKKVLIGCKKHGYIKMRPQSLLTGRGCPKCYSKSRGEAIIAYYLDKRNIDYEFQKKFPECKRQSELVFDFFLPDYSTCIEYQGIQHYIPVDNFGGEFYFNLTQERDKIKKDFCKSKNINLLEIRYNDNLVEKLTDFFKSHIQEYQIQSLDDQS